MTVKSSLVRSLYIFGEDTKTIEKWVNKFMEINDHRVQRALCEVVGEFPSDLRKFVFTQLLSLEDMNAKEFLADSLFSMYNFENRTDWLKRILDGADNSVRRVLASNINKIKSTQKRNEWIELITKDADSSVQEIIDKKLSIK